MSLTLRRPRSLSDALRGVGGAAIVAGVAGVASQLPSQCWILSCSVLECRASPGVTVCDDRLDGGGDVTMRRAATLCDGGVTVENVRIVVFGDISFAWRS